MVSPIAKWATRTGHRFTSSSDTLSIDVLAETNYQSTSDGGEGGIASVTFTINGVQQTPITSRSRRRPNYNETISPITGTLQMSDIYSYGFDLNASAYSNGTITISAVVTTVGGSTTTLDDIKVYNNKDSDTRPSNKVIYVSPSGNDSNDGLSEGNAVVTIQHALQLSATSGDMGGAEVVLLPGTHQWGGYSFGQYTGDDYFTSDDWWVKLYVRDGAVIEKPGTMSGNGSITFGENDSAIVRFQSSTSRNLNFLMILEGNTPQVTRGAPSILTDNTYTTRIAVEGGVFGHPSFDGTNNRWSVRFAEEKVRIIDHAVNTPGQGFVTAGGFMATNVTAQGTDNPFINIENNQDVKAEFWTAICWQSTSITPSSLVSNALITEQRYGGDVNGVIDSRINSGVALEIVDSDTVRLRRAASSDINPLGAYSIPNGNEQLDIDRHASELANSLRWGIGLTVGPEGSVEVIFEAAEVTSAGADGSEYVITLNIPSHGLSAISDLGNYGDDDVYMYCASRTDNGATFAGNNARYQDLIHPDVFQFVNTCTDTLLIGMRIVECKNTRIFASQSTSITRLAIVNCADDGLDKTDMSPGAGLIDCVFFHNNFYNFAFGSGSRSGVCEFRNNVCYKLTVNNTGITFDSNHFIDEGPRGEIPTTNTSLGTWYATDPAVSGSDFTPATSNQGTLGASPTVDYPADYVFQNAGGDSSKGSWRNTAQGFNIDGTSVTIVPGSGTIKITAKAPSSVTAQIPASATTDHSVVRLSVPSEKPTVTAGTVIDTFANVAGFGLFRTSVSRNPVTVTAGNAFRDADFGVLKISARSQGVTVSSSSVVSLDQFKKLNIFCYDALANTIAADPTVLETTAEQDPSFIPASEPSFSTPTDSAPLPDTDLQVSINSLSAVGNDVGRLNPRDKSSWTQNVIVNLNTNVARQVLNVNINQTR